MTYLAPLRSFFARHAGETLFVDLAGAGFRNDTDDDY